ncbi:PQQ-binding-like beta-propeller repeat protein [Kolteria novifilia]
MAALSLLLVVGNAPTENWPQFRGPSSDGVVVGEKVPVDWDAEKNVLWKFDVPGEGWSCPVIWGDKVFITAAIPESKPTEQAAAPRERRERAEGKGRRPEGDAKGRRGPPDGKGGERAKGRGGRGRSRRGGGYGGPDLTQTKYRWEIYCLDANTGKLLWKEVAREGKPPLPRHQTNTYATETPVTDGERVIAYFGMTGLYAYDVDGKPLWKKDLGNYQMRAGWGTASSPVLHDGNVFLQIDNEEQSFLIALDAKTGEEIWRVSRDEPSQYSSPIIWENSKGTELVTGGQFCRSYDPATGKLLWQLDMQKGRSSATPLAHGDRLYVGTEHRNRGGSDDGGGFLFAVNAGAKGDITPSGGATNSKDIAWVCDRSGIQMASPVICDGRIYLFERRSGLVSCIDEKTGEVLFRKRVPKAAAFWSSPWTHDGKVFALDDSGTTHVIEPGDDLTIVDTNPIDEQFWSTPAFAGGKLYLRGANFLYCIGNEGGK